MYTPLMLILKSIVFRFFFKWPWIDAKAIEFFSDIIGKTHHRRIDTGEKRNNIIDVIVEELKESKTKNNVNDSEFEKDAAIENLDAETILISNALLLFFGGFEPTSLGIAIITHKLALYPEFQEKVILEIDDVVGNSENVTFDQIQELKYLDMFINESFRFQDLVVALERQCTEAYTIPGTDITISTGRTVKLYTHDISTRENNFKSPKVFDPENFLSENAPNKFGLMMFGQGPRNCIGMRYALLTLKYSLVYLLRRHRVVRTANTPEKLGISIKNTSALENPMLVKIELRWEF